MKHLGRLGNRINSKVLMTPKKGVLQELLLKTLALPLPQLAYPRQLA